MPCEFPSQNSPLRLLDIDDMIVLALVGDGVSYADTARYLGLTPPAISHRLRKYEQLWPVLAEREPGSPRRIKHCSEEFKRIHKMAKMVLEVLSEEVHDSTSQLRAVG